MNQDYKGKPESERIVVDNMKIVILAQGIETTYVKVFHHDGQTGLLNGIGFRDLNQRFLPADECQESRRV